MVDAVDIMSAPVYVVSPEDTASHARMVMLEKDVGRLVVVEDDAPLGIVTKSDIGESNAQDEPPEQRRPIDSLRVSRIMTDDLVTVSPSADARDVASEMLDNDISGVPVVEDAEERYGEEGALLGIVTKKDITRHFASLDGDLDVSDLYTPDVKSVHRHSSLNHVVENMLDKGIHRLVIKEDNGGPVGIITKSDLAFTDLQGDDTGLQQKRLKMARKDSPAGEKKLRSVREVNVVAEDIMTEDVITVDMDTSASAAAELMLAKDISGLPVLRDGDVVGIVTETDIAKALSEGHT